MNKVTEVVFVVGLLPEWYDEGEHDFYLEQWLDGVAREQFDDVESVSVEYAYSGSHFIQAWDEDGDKISEVPFDMNGAFMVSKREAN